MSCKATVSSNEHKHAFGNHCFSDDHSGDHCDDHVIFQQNVAKTPSSDHCVDAKTFSCQFCTMLGTEVQ